MFNTVALVSLALAAAVLGQQIGNYTAETHPSLTVQQCSAGGSCTSQARSIVLDANWRWLHVTGNYTNCYTGNEWNTTTCPDNAACAKNCALDGADYKGTYGISASGNALTLKFVTTSQQKNIGSRVYLMQDQDNYQMFSLKNQEFTFDVDVSQLPCGLNGAVYFVSMDKDGGKSKFSTNKAGARYGTGYCDSQCPHDIKFINGEANVEGWTGSPNDTNAGSGQYGSCCDEMDLWEANSVSTAYTPHVCTSTGQTRCTGNDCGDADNRYGGICDKDGCDFNSFRQGVPDFYGPGMTVDTNSKFTIVTQFVTADGSANGALSEIRRFYVQNGQVVPNSFSTFTGLESYNSVSDEYCNAQKTLFGDTNSFEDRGGLKKMGDALQAGMVLVLSLWDDHAVNMLWLDSNYPTDKDASQPGIARGTCSTDSGKPTDVESQNANAQVIYSNIKYGPLNSTFTAR
ncbi:family 7 glycoside hydrolase [Hymenopellis radicata]|nr:family 7 glycoside hydrolase [Hymenopellis radicata]